VPSDTRERPGKNQRKKMEKENWFILGVAIGAIGMAIIIGSIK
jgi:hypothetical protein